MEPRCDAGTAVYVSGCAGVVNGVEEWLEAYTAVKDGVNVFGIGENEAGPQRHFGEDRQTIGWQLLDVGRGMVVFICLKSWLSTCGQRLSSAPAPGYCDMTFSKTLRLSGLTLFHLPILNVQTVKTSLQNVQTTKLEHRQQRNTPSRNIHRNLQTSLYSKTNPRSKTRHPCPPRNQSPHHRMDNPRIHPSRPRKVSRAW